MDIETLKNLLKEKLEYPYVGGNMALGNEEAIKNLDIPHFKIYIIPISTDQRSRSSGLFF